MKFAPLFIPFKRRFQTLGIMHYIFSFVFCAQTCILLFFYLAFFTRLWPLIVLYCVFLWFDWDTPNKGARMIYSVRDWAIWYGMRDYFPVKIVKTADLDPKKNYVLACHPHGVLCVGTFASICSTGAGIHKLFPGMDTRLTMLPVWFKIPFLRDYLMSGGLISSTKSSIEYFLKQPLGGNMIAILPGGAPESLYARPGDITLILRQRMGFIKLAKVHGVPLVPCFSFGDHDIWDQCSNEEGSFAKRLQGFMMKCVGITLPLFHARGIFQYNYGLLPRRRPIHFVVGKPIKVEKNDNPTSEELCQLRDHYIEKLQELFEAHRLKYLEENVKLIIT